MENKDYNRLLVIIPDALSEIISKGELTERYYNPGNLFKNVDLLLSNNDNFPSESINLLFGNAKYTINNMPNTGKLFFRTLGYREKLIKKWVSKIFPGIDNKIPDLIRCYGVDINIIIAYELKIKYGIPYIISLHTCPDENPSVSYASFYNKIKNKLLSPMIRSAFESADAVLPVYKAIMPYAKRMGAKNIKVLYNVINGKYLKKKEKYELHNPIRLLSVGRKIPGKNPENIIRALKYLPDCNLTIIGGGTLHEYSIKIAIEEGVDKRITFIQSMNNGNLCEILPDFDMFISHSDFLEIPKAVLEPLLTGLPVIINKHYPTPVPEYNSHFIHYSENTPESYSESVKKLAEDSEYREMLGKNAYVFSNENWNPVKTEAKYVEMYKEIMDK